MATRSKQKSADPQVAKTPRPQNALRPRRSAARSLKVEALELRMSADDKALLLQAAALEGRSLGDYVLQSALGDAVDRLSAQPDLTFSLQGFAELLRLLDNPPPLDEAVVARLTRAPPWRR